MLTKKKDWDIKNVRNNRDIVINEFVINGVQCTYYLVIRNCYGTFVL